MYTVAGMTDKNKDVLLKDLLDLVGSSNNQFLQRLFPDRPDPDSKKRPPTAGDKIKVKFLFLRLDFPLSLMFSKLDMVYIGFSERSRRETHAISTLLYSNDQTQSKPITDRIRSESDSPSDQVLGIARERQSTTSWIRVQEHFREDG